MLQSSKHCTCSTRIPSSCSPVGACGQSQNPNIPIPCGCSHHPCSESSATICRPGSSPCEYSCKPCGCKGGYLLPKIIAHGREWLRRCNASLCLQLRDDCVEGPFSLLSLTPMSDQLTWDVIPQPSPTRILLHVTVPLLCQVRDRHGCLHEATASINTDVCLFYHHPCHDHRSSTTLIQPSIRLACMPSPSQDLCFNVQLEVLIDAYMIRWEPYLPSSTTPCVDVPLYPELRT